MVVLLLHCPTPPSTTTLTIPSPNHRPQRIAHEGDTRDPDAWRVAAAGARAIVHAAAIVAAKTSHEEFFAVNVGGTGQAIAAAREAGARLVHVSSVAVYGRTPGVPAGGVDEATPLGKLQPHDFYAQSKRRAETRHHGDGPEWLLRKTSR